MLTIRQAKASDCDTLCAARRESIVRHFAPSHGERVARQWADGVDGKSCAQWLSSKITIVAEEHGLTLAFAGFDPGTAEIEVVATETAEQRAIPAALVAVIEAEARARELDSLAAIAVPGSEKLFTMCGFDIDVKHSLAHGERQGPPSVRLSKKLVYPEPRPERRRNVRPK